MNDKITSDIVNKLASSISDDVGNMHEDNLEEISNSFNNTLNKALKIFNSNAFDNDGFIRKMRDLDLDDKKDKELMRNVLNNIKSDYISADIINQSELLLKRDINNICTQMPEMHDVIHVIRDAIIECNVSTGEVSRSIIFENHEDNESYESHVKEIERDHDLLMAIKNFIIIMTLINGELYVQISPFSKIFSELISLKKSKYINSYSMNNYTESKNFKNSNPKNNVSLFNEENVKILMESVSPITKIDTTDVYRIEKNSNNLSDSVKSDTVNSKEIENLLKNINIYNGSSVLMTEIGEDGIKYMMNKELTEKKIFGNTKYNHFEEALSSNGIDVGMNKFDIEDIDEKMFNNIKGCYIKYLDPLRMIPIRMDRRVIGYYYISTTMDLQTTTAQPNGMIDLSFQNYTRDKNLVSSLANMIIKSFDKKMLEKNIKLKNEIVEILMAHKFSEGNLSFIFIPEDEIIRFVINEDFEGKGHSVLEPSIFSARNYLMLTMYNMLYMLNNNTTRIYYVKSSGLNKDYAAQIQRTMRKFQSRRITIDDIYSYSGVLNKIGGMGQMVLPAGRNGYKALETDTIEAIRNPIDIEFLEQQRRQALSGTGSPNLLVINAIDEVDFAKTLEMANARFLSTVSSYKIDFNKGFTKMYQTILRYDTDLEEDIIQSMKFKFNAAKQQELNITADMITNFNSLVEVVSSIYYKKTEMEDEKGIPTAKQINLRKELAKKYLPQLDFDELDEIVKRVDILSNDDLLQQRVSSIKIEEEDLEDIKQSL